MIRLFSMGRYSLLGLIVILVILISTTKFNAQPSPFNHAVGRSSSMGSPSRPSRSAWFSEGGYLRFDNKDGLETTYEIWGEGADGYLCDGQEEREDGETICLNRLRLTESLYENAGAQNRSLRASAKSEKEKAILRRSYAELGGLRGKRILYLGDSIDRYALDDLGDGLPTSSMVVIFPENGKVFNGPARESGWTTRFLNFRISPTPPSPSPSVYSVSDPLHPDDFRIDFIFTFGITFFGTPAKFLERIALVEKVLADDVKYDLIVIDSGMWDINRIQEQNPNLDLSLGLPSDVLAQYIQLYVSVIERLRERYGSKIPLALRPTHSVHPGMTDHKFNPLRGEHLRQAQTEVAIRTGATVLPFARLMRHQTSYYRDGYHPNPAANMLHMETVLRLVAEA